MKTIFVCFFWKEIELKKKQPFVLLMQNEIIIIHNNVYFSRFDEILFTTI